MDIFRLAALGILAALAALLFRQKQPEVAALLSLGCGIAIFSAVLGRITVLLPYLEQMMGYLGEGEDALKILLKAGGITVVAEFAAGLCRDSQMASVGEMIRVFAKISLFVMGMPVLIAVIDLIGGYLI